MTDWYLHFFNRYEIWQASWQYCCWSAWQIFSVSNIFASIFIGFSLFKIWYKMSFLEWKSLGLSQCRNGNASSNLTKPLSVITLLFFSILNILLFCTEHGNPLWKTSNWSYHWYWCNFSMSKILLDFISMINSCVTTIWAFHDQTTASNYMETKRPWLVTRITFIIIWNAFD